MNAPTITTDNSTLPQNPFDNAVLLNLSRSSWGNLRKLPMSLLEIDADKELIGAHKRLVECKELQDIYRFDSRLTDWLETRCVGSVFKRGIYLVPLALLEEVNTRLEAYRCEREAMIDAACEKLFGSDGEFVKARLRLRAAYNELDYPADAPSFVRRFTVSWNYMEVQAPTNLQKFDPKLYAQAKQQLQEEIQKTSDEITAVLRKEFLDLVAHLQERLTVGTDGKPKSFHQTAIAKVHDFVATFHARNLTNDGDLKVLVDQVAELTSGVDPTLLKSSAKVRSQIHQGFAGITKSLQSMMKDKPLRAISFEEEGDSE